MARPLVIYHTPGRECAHADKGCCPPCMDPVADKGADWRKIVFSVPKRKAA